MELWTVYDHPTDYPDEFVARLWIVKFNNTVEATQTVITDSTLEGLRTKLQANPNLVSIKRYLEDEPQIIEVWL
jgi:hypothetical protein